MIGIKTADKASQPAYFVPQYLQQQGVKVYPVPVSTFLLLHQALSPLACCAAICICRQPSVMYTTCCAAGCRRCHCLCTGDLHICMRVRQDVAFV